MSSLTNPLLLQLATNKPKQHSQLEKGFTLVELMIVVVIVGILSSIAVPSFLNQQNKAKAACAETQVSALAKEQQIFFAENSAFATALGTSDGELDTTPPTTCNGYSTITLNAATVQATPTTEDGFCVIAKLDSSTGAYTLDKKKGLC